MMQNDKEKEPEINIIPVETDESEHSSEEDIKTESAESYIEQLQRLQADFINYKRRTEKEMHSLSIFVKGNLINSLLPVIDDGSSDTAS
jgi:molecular chaperone GrpE